MPISDQDKADLEAYLSCQVDVDSCRIAALLRDPNSDMSRWYAEHWEPIFERKRRERGAALNEKLTEATKPGSNSPLSPHDLMLLEWEVYCADAASPDVAARIVAMLMDPASALNEWFRGYEAYLQERKRTRRARLRAEWADLPDDAAEPDAVCVVAVVRSGEAV